MENAFETNKEFQATVEFYENRARELRAEAMADAFVAARGWVARAFQNVLGTLHLRHAS